MDRGTREILLAALVMGAMCLGAYIGDTIATRRMEAALGEPYGPQLMERWVAGGACLVLRDRLIETASELTDDIYMRIEDRRTLAHEGR